MTQLRFLKFLYSSCPLLVNANPQLRQESLNTYVSVCPDFRARWKALAPLPQRIVHDEDVLFPAIFYPDELLTPGVLVTMSLD